MKCDQSEYIYNIVAKGFIMFWAPLFCRAQCNLSHASLIKCVDKSCRDATSAPKLLCWSSVILLYYYSYFSYLSICQPNCICYLCFIMYCCVSWFAKCLLDHLPYFELNVAYFSVISFPLALSISFFPPLSPSSLSPPITYPLHLSFSYQDVILALKNTQHHIFVPFGMLLFNIINNAHG